MALIDQPLLPYALNYCPAQRHHGAFILNEKSTP
jgi:hypothetical protein